MDQPNFLSGDDTRPKLVRDRARVRRSEPSQITSRSRSRGAGAPRPGERADTWKYTSNGETLRDLYSLRGKTLPLYRSFHTGGSAILEIWQCALSQNGA